MISVMSATVILAITHYSLLVTALHTHTHYTITLAVNHHTLHTGAGEELDITEELDPPPTMSMHDPAAH